MTNLKRLITSVMISALLISALTFTTAQAATKKQTIKQETAPTDSTNPTEPSEAVNDNVLYGKFIYTDGDSITKGAKVPVDTLLGTRPTYAALTADRNQANYLTNAISGTTMGCINANGKEYQGFASTAYKRYKNLVVWNKRQYAWQINVQGTVAQEKVRQDNLLSKI